MLGRRDEIARLQSDFYRNQFHRLLRWMMVALVIIYILMGSIIYKILFKSPPRYYANTSEGRILPMPHSKTGG